MKNIILCGGHGKRLWPLSRSNEAKQFVRFFNNESLFQLCLKRNKDIVDEFIIVLNKEQIHIAKSQLRELNLNIPYRFIMEGAAKNTAPAIFYAVASVDENANLFVSPSDQYIDDLSLYRDCLQEAEGFAEQNKIVTFGIKPRYPETGFGYIELDKGQFLSFREKPDLKTAETFFQSGRHFWNSGMFCFKASLFLKELKSIDADYFNHLNSIYSQRQETKDGIEITKESLSDLKANSIDFALMEKTKNIAAVTASFTWDDLGTFESLGTYYEKIKNTKTESHLNSKSIHYYGHKNLFAIDVEDLILVETADSILLSKKGSSAKIQDFAEEIKQKDLAQNHNRDFRPWGYYQILFAEAGAKIKKILVYPEQKLSLQSHVHRQEHWVIKQGKAAITINDSVKECGVGEAVIIQPQEKHRIENLSITEDLVFFEIQLGDNLAESDIIRYEDSYGRA